MKKVLLITIAIILSISLATTALANESPSGYPVDESSIATTALANESPLCRPVDPNSIGELISVETKTYVENGMEIKETTSTYEKIPEVSLFGSTRGTTYYKETSATLNLNSELAYIIKLDADFETDATANTATCTRYYSSYEEYQSLYSNPEEVDASFTEGYLLNGKAYAKATTKYEYKRSMSGTRDSLKLKVGCDSAGKTVS